MTASSPSQRPSRSAPSRRIAIATIAAVCLLAPLAAHAPEQTAAAAAGSSAPDSAVDQAAPTEFDTAPGRYIVRLAGEPAASYTGGVAGLAATSPRDGARLDSSDGGVSAYGAHLRAVQDELAASVGARIERSFTLTVNGFSADLTAEQVAALNTDHRVEGLERQRLHSLSSGDSSASAMGLDGAGGVWDTLGGGKSAGAGVVIGVLDSGIAPENPAFAGAALGTDAGEAPYRSGDDIVFRKADGSRFVGRCEAGEQFGPDDCTTKIIGARSFHDGIDDAAIGDAAAGEYRSPRDGSGHGSHTAAIAAGAPDVPAPVAAATAGRVSGVAPAAKLAVYKVCWTGPDSGRNTDDVCPTVDIVAGIEQAVADGVDVLNYSIGAAEKETSTFSATDDAFLGAAAAGVFVATAAGNFGAKAGSVRNTAPWVTTVAASSIPAAGASVTLGDGQSFLGTSVTVPQRAGARVTGPIAYAGNLVASGANQRRASVCAAGSIDPAAAKGRIIVCENGTVRGSEKSAELKRVEATGMILVNVAKGETENDPYAVPTVHLPAAAHDPLLVYASQPDATVSLEYGNMTGRPSPPTPVVRNDSGRGPVPADGSDLIKPDLAAPGSGILSAGANAAGAEPSFRYLSGTSMASPHIAGLAALYLGKHPGSRPSVVKSAMMTTATDTQRPGGGRLSDPFVQGSGQVNPAKILRPGLVFDSGSAEWNSYLVGTGYRTEDSLPDGGAPIDGSQLNLPSIGIGALTAPEEVERTVTATTAGRYTAAVTQPAGVKVSVSPETLDLAEGEKATITVRVARTDGALDRFAAGRIQWSGPDGISVRMPVAVRPVTIDAPPTIAGEGERGSARVALSAAPEASFALEPGLLVPATRYAGTAGSNSKRTGAGSVGDVVEFPVVVPKGTRAGQLRVVNAGEGMAVSITLYQLNDLGQPAGSWKASAGRSLDLVAPAKGQYIAQATITAGSGEFDVEGAWVRPHTSATPLGASTAELPAEGDTQREYTLDWDGLAPGKHYLGAVGYGGAGALTFVNIDTPSKASPSSRRSAGAADTER